MNVLRALPAEAWVLILGFCAGIVTGLPKLVDDESPLPFVTPQPTPAPRPTAEPSYRRVFLADVTEGDDKDENTDEEDKDDGTDDGEADEEGDTLA